MSILGTALQLRAKCSGEKHLVALFLFCCTRTFFLSKRRCEGSVVDGDERLYSRLGRGCACAARSTNVPGAAAALRSTPRRSLPCRGGTSRVPDSASQQLHWPEVKKRSSSPACAAASLLPFKLLRFFLWLYGKIYWERSSPGWCDTGDLFSLGLPVRAEGAAPCRRVLTV